MACMIKRVLSTPSPITLEAPIIRRRRDLTTFIKSSKQHYFIKKIIGLNLTNYPMGILSSDPVTIGCYLKRELNIEVIPHITSSLERRYTLVRTLLTAEICEINNFLVLGGDIKDEHGLRLEEVYEIIDMFRKGEITLNSGRWIIDKIDFCVGGALIPYRERELDRVLWKIDKGVKFFQTQIIVERKKIFMLLDELDRKLGEKGVNEPIPILVGVAPFKGNIVFKWIRENIGKISETEFEYRNYEKYMVKLSKMILSEGNRYNNISLGLHVIPIEWKAGIYEKLDSYIGELD